MQQKQCRDAIVAEVQGKHIQYSRLQYFARGPARVELNEGQATGQKNEWKERAKRKSKTHSQGGGRGGEEVEKRNTTGVPLMAWHVAHRPRV